MRLLNKMLGKEGEDRDARFLSRQGIRFLCGITERCSTHAITKTYLDEILIMDRELGNKLLRAFTKTLSKRLRETNERMAGFLAI